MCLIEQIQAGIAEYGIRRIGTYQGLVSAVLRST